MTPVISPVFSPQPEQMDRQLSLRKTMLVSALASSSLMMLTGAGVAEPLPALPPLVIVTPDRLLAAPTGPSTLGEQNPAWVGGTREPYHPFFEIDWSVGLQTSHSWGTEGSRYATSLTPQFSATHTGLRERYGFAAEASLGVNSDQLTRIEQVLLSASGQIALDRVTQVTGAAGLTVSQEDPNAPGMDDDIVQTPLEMSGQIELGIARQFGGFGLALTGDLARTQVGETILVGNISQNNNERNETQLGVGLRGEYELTPIVTGFVEGSLAHDWFDRAPPSSGIKQDGWDFALAVGLAANWRDVWQVEASVGQGLRRFDDASLADLTTLLYALDLAYTPNDAFSFNAQLTTTLSPADVTTGSSASVDYGLVAGAGYQVAPFMGLRASISQVWDVPLKGSDHSVAFTAGAGADFDLNKNISLSLDYLYTTTQTPPAKAEDEHELALGLTWSR